jgi:hypothetical protein
MATQPGADAAGFHTQVPLGAGKCGILICQMAVLQLKHTQTLIMFAGLLMFAVINSKHESYRSYKWRPKGQYAYFF